MLYHYNIGSHQCDTCDDEIGLGNNFFVFGKYHICEECLRSILPEYIVIPLIEERIRIQQGKE